MAKKDSFVEKIKTLIDISRPINVAMVVFGVLVTFFARPPGPLNLELLFPTIIAAAFIAAGGNAINDYYDVFIDKINRPDRPLPSGKITLRGIWAYAFALFAIGIVVSWLLPFWSFLIAFTNAFLLAIYAYRLKRSGFFGDLVISYLVASVFIFAGTAIDNLEIGFILAIAAFFTNTAREILKDLEDIKGDKMFGVRTLPLIAGRKKSVIFVSSFLVISILVSPFPYTLGILTYPYLVVAFVADGIFAYIIYLLRKNTDLATISKTQRLVKFGALFGLVAFLVGAIPL
ncbi:TPA: UbiA family prenyltransferase [archaeon]|nr:UbiA family prenyltransferase [Candidatus Naiadarchaeales archaeon SRR2090159.bin1288]